MPIYEYRCHDCKRRVSIFWRSFSAAETGKPVCPVCGSEHLTRLMSRVRVISATGGLEDMDDPSFLSDFDENDPRSMARVMRRMVDETGEDPGPEFEQVVERLERGEDPAEIEKSLPDLGNEPI